MNYELYTEMTSLKTADRQWCAAFVITPFPPRGKATAAVGTRRLPVAAVVATRRKRR
jgi:hypothetical protein